jgi:hypothetical protein
MPTRYHRSRRLTVGTAHPTSVTSGPYRVFSDNMLSVTDGFSPPLASPPACKPMKAYGLEAGS